jgi:NADPH:quinone reductase-like Zn-dependent oxidoreductase
LPTNRALRLRQVIDYRKHAPLDSYLTTTYASAPFDVFFDTVGDYSLYRRSPAYTKRACTYVNVGVLNGPGANMRFMFRAMWPAALGGTPRKYVFQNTVCELGVAEELVQLVDGDKLKVLVDCVWNMEDGLEVST